LPFYCQSRRLDVFTSVVICSLKRGLNRGEQPF